MKVFSSVGVEAGQYENTRRSLPVQALVKKQDDAVETLNVTSTPSFTFLANTGSIMPPLPAPARMIMLKNLLVSFGFY